VRGTRLTGGHIRVYAKEMGDNEEFSNDTPDLQDAIRSIGAIGEDTGAKAGDADESTPPDSEKPGSDISAEDDAAVTER